MDEYIRQRNNLINERLRNVNHGNNRDESNNMRRKLNEDLRKLFNGEFNIPVNIETDNNLINRVNNLRNRKAVLDTNKQNLENQKKDINNFLRRRNITEQERLNHTNLKLDINARLVQVKFNLKDLLNEAKTVLNPRLNKYDDYMRLLRYTVEEYTDLRYNPNIGPNLHPEFQRFIEREARIQNTRYEYSIIDKEDPILQRIKNYSFECMLYAWFQDSYRNDLGFFPTHIVIILDYIRNKHPISMRVPNKNNLTFRQLLDHFTRYQELYDDDETYDLQNMTITVRASENMEGGATPMNFKKSKYTINTNTDSYCGQIALMYSECSSIKTAKNINSPSMKENLDKRLKEFIKKTNLTNEFMTPTDFAYYEMTNNCRIIIIDEEFEIYYRNRDKDIENRQKVIYLSYYKDEAKDIGHYEWIYNIDKFIYLVAEICKKCNLLRKLKQPCSNEDCEDHFNLSCISCKYKFNSLITYNNHMIEKGVFKCSNNNCDKEFKYKACLGVHIKKDHIQGKKIRCDNCYKILLLHDMSIEERVKQHSKNGCKFEKRCSNCNEYFNNFNKENGIVYCDNENHHNCNLFSTLADHLISAEKIEEHNNKFDHYAYDIESFVIKEEDFNGDKIYNKNIQDIAKIGFINIDDLETNEVEIYNKSNFEEFIEFLLTIENKTIFWAHYASGYDSRMLIKKFCDYDPTLISKPRFKNSKIYEFTFNKKVMFRDSFLHLPFSLDNLAKEFKLNIRKTIFPYNFYTEENKNYIGSKPDLEYFTKSNIKSKFDKIKDLWMKIEEPYNIDKVCNEYLNNDVIMLAQCLNKYRDNAIDMYKVNPLNCLTQGQYAIELFKWQYMKENSISFVPDSVNVFLEKSYYGGRCEAFRTQFMGSIFAKDVSSLYPSVMLMDTLPSKFIRYSSLNLTGWNDCHLYLKSIINQGYVGFFKVDVIVPKTLIRPLLPTKDIQGEMKTEKLIFSCADILEHTYYIFELLKAIELGYKITNIIDECIFEGSNELFKDFIIDLGIQKKKFSEEDEKGNKLYPVQRQITKLTLNSTYGKFGQKFFSQNQMIIPYSQKDKWFKLVDQERKEHILITDTIELAKCVIVKYDREQLFERKNSLALASAITAMGRLRLYEAIQHYSDKVVYCDTDSVYVAGKDDGWDTQNYCSTTGFGKWDLEISDGVEFVSSGSKSYAVKNIKGDIMVKAKGFAKGLIDMEDLKFIVKGFSKNIEIDDLAIYNGKDIYFRDNNTKNLSVTLDKGYQVGCFILPHCLSINIVEKYNKMCELYGENIIKEYDKMFHNHNMFSCKSKITKKLLNSM
jgi:hypothetical protein